MDKEIIMQVRQAIKLGDLEQVKILMESNDELINVTTVFGSWLHDASTYGQYDIAKYLIECGIDINVRGGVSDSGAITTAAFKGNYDIVKMLLSNGAELDISSSDRNPLFAAIYNGHFDIVQYLVENGIDITVHYAMGKLEKVDAYKYARQYGQTEIANYLKKKLEER